MPHRDMSQCTANIFILLNLLCSAAPEKCKHDVCIVQPYRVVATEGVATVECRYSSPPHPHPEELSVALLKGLHGNEVVCWGKLNSTQLSWSTSGEPHACHTRMTNRGFNITVSGLKGGDTDIYRCQVVVRYPPPYRTRTGNGTLVYVPEKPVCSLPEIQLLVGHRPPQLEPENWTPEPTATGQERQDRALLWVQVSLPLLLFLLVSTMFTVIYQIARVRHARRQSTQPLSKTAIV
ncbi:cytotoxic T-lymphocyte protein 4-like isoform X1 [Engraulis encrasicolus]|uniref:cytotoxic T-lymphocyte protein 4-like isoform X1 n=1 Tax=Engraulis encrasicolus TaxID=184585 RepID=UPI002FCFF339